MTPALSDSNTTSRLSGFGICYSATRREWIFVARFFEKIENGILKFQKNLKKNPDVDNDMIYQRAKFELDIPSILGYTKMTNSDRW
jgi:hypothetical protein